ncbi:MULTISPECIES: hypothetical protein [Streptomyces]|uniref:Uncharacterized protein n=1 Tax=Streptomyces harbinensis TaxID=1176198 RepID=A0A1I6WB97_9ACTN|nr:MULTISPECIES: hypothetical protein [Streptomyces]SFT23258.1 hypothetical protein SAMN05444716_1179 [Streptomyces harbinensis]
METVWLVVRGEDPGATPCADREAAMRYATLKWIEDEYNGEDAEATSLRWEDDELMDDSQPDWPGTGWAVFKAPVITTNSLHR